jgi:hypothetical protein
MALVTLSGHNAIEVAEVYNLDGLAMYNSPIESAKDLTLFEAKQVAKEDPSLVYLEVPGWSFRPDNSYEDKVKELLGSDDEELLQEMCQMLERYNKLYQQPGCVLLLECTPQEWAEMLEEAEQRRNARHIIECVQAARDSNQELLKELGGPSVVDVAAEMGIGRRVLPST